MSYLVETFEEKECYEELDVDRQDEALKLVEDLGLDGQKTLQTKAGDRCPYRELTKEEMFVYGYLLQKKEDAKAYAGGPMPLRVLQVLSHAKEFFKEVQVWHQGAGSPDPVLVGVKEGSESWRKTYFLLARWGLELKDFAVLRKEACDKFRVEFRSKCLGIVAEAQAASERILTDDECFTQPQPHTYGLLR